MRVTPIISLGLSVVVGIGAIVLGRVWLTGNADAGSSPIATVLPQPKPQKVEATRIAVSSVLLENGDLVNLDSVKMVDWPVKFLPEGAITEIDDLKNADGSTPFAKGVILEGEPLLIEKLSVQPVLTKLAAQITPGMRAYSISVTPDTGVSGLVLPGDRVDVASVRTEIVNPQTQETKSLVTTVMRDVKVLAADQAFNEYLQGSLLARNVTLEVTSGGAARLALAQEKGQLFLTLRSEKQDRVAPVKRTVAKLKPKPAPKKAEFTNVRVIQGEAASIVTTPSASGESVNLQPANRAQPVPLAGQPNAPVNQPAQQPTTPTPPPPSQQRTQGRAPNFNPIRE
ncbi:MAG: Flp pilus assembly protein CpaB [Pseudomonadota bacterium]